MILVVGTFRVDPARLDAARPAMAAMIAGSRAEPGCIHYSYSEDLSDVGLIHVIERWQDRASLDLHLETSHLKMWRSMWVELGIGDRDLKLYHVSESECF